MAITNIDTFINALANNGQQFVFNKLGVANAIIGQSFSHWLTFGVPAPGIIPTTPEICAKGLLGGLQWDNPTGGNKSYLARVFITSSIAATDIEFYDRLAHMGGLSGTLTTEQTVGVDVTGTDSNLAVRRGDADYSDVQWWLEWYLITGATARDLTVTYTNGAGTTGRIASIPSGVIGTSARPGRMINILDYAQDSTIQSVQSVQWSAGTGTIGNFGVTATRRITGRNYGALNVGLVSDLLDLGLIEIPNDACIAIMVRVASTATGTMYGSGKLIQG